jgi:hypothetical protein
MGPAEPITVELSLNGAILGCASTARAATSIAMSGKTR